MAEPDRRVEATPRWPEWVHRGLSLAVVALYVALVLAGATASSLGVRHLRQDPTVDLHDRWGQLQPIRSDEYNVFTPIRLSTMETGGAATISVLSEEASIVHRYPVGPVFQRLAYGDASLTAWLGQVLPHQMLFSAFWWLPSFLTLLLMPRWFALMGARRSLGWLAGILVVLSPSNFWWSFQPVQHVGITLAGCTAMLAAHRGWRAGARGGPVALAVLGGLLIAGLPSSYIAWALVLGLPILLASVVRLALTSRSWGAALPVLAMTGGVAAVVGFGALWEGRVGLQSVLGTVYPGQRAATAVRQPLDFVFGAPFLSQLNVADPVGTNASELSTSFTIAIPLLVAAWVLTRVWHRRTLAARAPELVIGVFAGAWLAWASVDLGALGARLPLLNRVEPYRAAQVVGILGVIGLCLALSHLPRRSRVVPAVLLAVGAGLLSGYAGQGLMRGEFPEMGWAPVVVGGLGVALASFLLFWRPRALVTTAVTSALALSVVAQAGPLQFGLGDLRGSSTARYLLERSADARADGTLWVSDSGAFSSLLTATGTPTVSGLMRSGPRRDLWERLDPDGRFEQAWNRGGGYLNIGFHPGDPTLIETDGFDQVFLSVDPCVLAEAVPGIAKVVALQPVEAGCLVASGQLTWSGVPMQVYDVVP